MLILLSVEGPGDYSPDTRAAAERREKRNKSQWVSCVSPRPVRVALGSKMRAFNDAKPFVQQKGTRHFMGCEWCGHRRKHVHRGDPKLSDNRYYP